MKIKLITNTPKLLLLALVACLFAGCAATRPISDVALGAGGSYLGHELSNGDPLVTAAGAAGGVIVSETLHYAAKDLSGSTPASGVAGRASRPALARMGFPEVLKLFGAVDVFREGAENCPRGAGGPLRQGQERRRETAVLALRLDAEAA